MKRFLYIALILLACSCTAERDAGKWYEGDVTINAVLDTSARRQTWDGFGAANKWGDATYWSVRETDLLMGNLGLNIMRIRISPDETKWPNLIAGCKYAYEKYGALILASPWTMPASMKDNGDLKGRNAAGEHSHLKKECYEEYALYLERFAAFMKENGAPLYAISVQNEPDWPAEYEGCVWSAGDILEFVRDYGHLVKSARLVSGESMNFDRSYYTPLLEDEKACANFDIAGGHLYGSSPSRFDLVAAKGKRLWMTEHLLNDSWNKGTSHWTETMDMLKEIDACLKAGFNAYIWWWAVRYYSLLGDGEQGTSANTILTRGHAYGQYSSHVKPGSTRVEITPVKEASGLLMTAFMDSDGQRIAIVIVNPSAKEFPSLVIDAGGTVASATASFAAADSRGPADADFHEDMVRVSLPASSVSALEISLK